MHLAHLAQDGISCCARHCPTLLRMNRQRSSRHVLPAVFFAAVLLAACGGDGDATVDTVPPVSSSSTTTVPPTSSTTTTSTTEPPEFVGEPEFDSASSVSTVGIDVVTFGMTVTQAEDALGGSLVPMSEPVEDDCYQIRPAGGPEGVQLTVTAGTIERVDISTDTITTRSGAGVGMSEDDLFALFGERLTSTPLAGGGNSIMFTPADEGDAQFRVIFDTDGTAVTTFRSGRVPQIEPTVPCS